MVRNCIHSSILFFYYTNHIQTVDKVETNLCSKQTSVYFYYIYLGVCRFHWNIPENLRESIQDSQIDDLTCKTCRKRLCCIVTRDC